VEECGKLVDEVGTLGCDRRHDLRQEPDESHCNQSDRKSTSKAVTTQPGHNRFEASGDYCGHQDEDEDAAGKDNSGATCRSEQQTDAGQEAET